MFKRSHAETSHIPYSPVGELSDVQLSDEITRMTRASDINPRKEALRLERIHRQIAVVGLAQAEVMLGITAHQEANNG